MTILPGVQIYEMMVLPDHRFEQSNEGNR